MSTIENPNFERKTAFIQEKELAAEFSAFANSSVEGGLVVLGIEKDKSLIGINIVGQEKINKLIQAAEQQGITAWVITSSGSQEFEKFRHEVNLAAPYYFGDGTVLKTIMRANPGIVLLEDGTVKGKWHHNDTPAIEELIELL